MSQATIPIRAASISLPRPIGRALGRLDRRLRTSSFWRGLGTTALVIAAGAALGIAADFAWVLPQAARWAIWGAWLAAGSFAIIVTVLRPIVRRFVAFDLAALAEQTHPELGEQLTGTVSLLGGVVPAHGSPALIAALAERAAAVAATVDPSRASSWRPAALRLACGLLAFGMLAAPLGIWPATYGTLARRFLMPWAAFDRVGRLVLTVAPGDRVMAIGAELTFTASVRARFGADSVPEGAWLEWSADGQAAGQRVAMPHAPDPESRTAVASAASARAFAVTLPALARSISYRVESGSARSRWYHINAVEPPAVASIEARVEPPAYTRLPIKLTHDPARIVAFEGSRVTLEIVPSRPVRLIELQWPTETGKSAAERKVTASLASDGKSGSVTVVAEASGPYAVALRDENEIASRPQNPGQVVVRPDAPPVIAVWGMEGLREASRDDLLVAVVAARDDIAVASVELHYVIERRGSTHDEPEPGHVEVSLPGLGSRSARGAATMALEPLALKTGDQFSYRLRVTDNRPAPRGPNVVWSPVQSLSIVDDAEPIRARQSQARRTAMRTRLDAAKKAVAADRREIEQLRQAADSVRRGSGVWDEARQRALDERAAAARAEEDRLELLARDLADIPRLRPLARSARQIAEVEAEAVRAALEQARREDAAARRLADLEQAAGRLGAVNERLEDLERKLGELGPSEAGPRRLRELAVRQKRIAASAEATIDRAQLDRLQAQQNAVRRDLDDLLKFAPELRARVLDSQTQEAERLAAAARALAQRQREESRAATDLSKQGRALDALAAAQRALEDDARRLALEVDQPLAENGRGRLNADSIRQAAEPIARGDLEQARERLEGAEIELRRLARDLEDVPGDPKALAGRLARRQDALNRDVDEALGSIRGKTLNGEEKAAFAARIKALTQRQQAIARLTKTIQPPAGKEGRNRFPQDAARDALQKTARAALALPTQKAQEIDGRKQEARLALDRLANELQDYWRRQEPARQKLDEARRISNEVANEIAQHLRETDPRPERPSTTAGAAEELARRLHDTADKQARAVTALEGMEAEPRVEPQRARAARRAQALAGALRDLRDPAKREWARAVLPGVEAEAHAAMDRLEQKQNGRVPADDLAAELVDDARQLEQDLVTAKPGEPARDRAERAAAGLRLAGALRNLNAPDAPLAQAEAVRLAARTAGALTGPQAKTYAGAPLQADARAALHDAVEAAQALADQLADRQSPRVRAAALARAERALDDPEIQADLALAAQRQWSIAGELARLPLELGKKAAASGRVEYAAALAGRAVGPGDDQPAAGRPSAAALAAARASAAAALDALAALPDRPLQVRAEPAAANSPLAAQLDPELRLGPGHVAATNDLARRERRIRERLQAILGQRVEPQQALRRESIALGRELAGLRERIRPFSNRAEYAEQEAVQHLGAHAPQAMRQAVEHLSQGHTLLTREAQRRSAELVERGAQHAEDLVAALRAERREAAAEPNGEGRPPRESRLGEARDSMHQAASQLAQARDPDQASGAMPAARQSMHAAARALRAAAAAADVTSLAGDPGPAASPADADDSALTHAANPNGSELDPESRPGVKAEPDLTELQALIRRRTGRAWGELPGHLRTEILQMSAGRYREDYARLIQLYFREIAADPAGNDKPE